MHTHAVIRARALPALLALAGVALAGCAGESPPAASVPGVTPPPSPVTAADGSVAEWTDWLPYGAEERQRMRVLPGEPSGGVAVLVHGGSWRAGSAGTYVDPGSTMHALTRGLHDDGWWVVAVEYRFADRSPWPTTARDVHSATRAGVRWATERGAGETLAMLGDSAGGHLASLEGATHPTQVDAVVSYYGLHDFTTSQAQREARNCPTMNVGAPNVFGVQPTSDEQLAVARHWSPAHRVAPDSPPMMVLHGTEDCVVPYEQAGELVEALTAHGVPNELVTLPGEGHGSPAFVDPETTLPRVLDFLAEHSDPVVAPPAQDRAPTPAAPTAGEWRP